MEKVLKERIAQFKQVREFLTYPDGLHNVERAINIIDELEEELKQANISNVYWELCYNKEKEAHEKLRAELIKFSEKNFKQSQKGYYGCNCYSEIDGILGNETK
jgi:hypothetical protein